MCGVLVQSLSYPWQGSARVGQWDPVSGAPASGTHPLTLGVHSGDTGEGRRHNASKMLSAAPGTRSAPGERKLLLLPTRGCGPALAAPRTRPLREGRWLGGRPCPQGQAWDLKPAGHSPPCLSKTLKPQMAKTPALSGTSCLPNRQDDAHQGLEPFHGEVDFSGGDPFLSHPWRPLQGELMLSYPPRSVERSTRGTWTWPLGLVVMGKAGKPERGSGWPLVTQLSVAALKLAFRPLQGHHATRSGSACTQAPRAGLWRPYNSDHGDLLHQGRDLLCGPKPPRVPGPWGRLGSTTHHRHISSTPGIDTWDLFKTHHSSTRASGRPGIPWGHSPSGPRTKG